MRTVTAAIAAYCCAGAIPLASAQFTVTVDGTARYQGDSLKVGSQTVIDPPQVPGDVASISVLSDPAMDGFSYAKGESRFGYDALGGYSRNFARASGWSPGHGSPDEVFATSRSTATVAYRVSSPTTPIGTPIEVKCFLAYSGELGVANYFGSTSPGELTASFGSTFAIDGVTLFDGSAVLEQRFSNSQSAPIFTTAGPWGASWTGSVEQEPSMGDYNAMTLSHADVVNFNTVMAADFDVVFTQFAAAQIPGPFEAFAHADFTNTGRFSFRAFDPATGQEITDAEFTFVPAPGMAPVGLALLAAAMRRRR